MLKAEYERLNKGSMVDYYDSILEPLADKYDKANYDGNELSDKEMLEMLTSLMITNCTNNFTKSLNVSLDSIRKYPRLLEHESHTYAVIDNIPTLAVRVNTYFLQSFSYDFFEDVDQKILQEALDNNIDFMTKWVVEECKWNLIDIKKPTFKTMIIIDEEDGEEYEEFDGDIIITVN